MPPNSETIPPSSLGMKPPPRRQKLQTVDMWLEDKRETDGAEGLWRVGDSLYDLNEFIRKHPGGPEWLELSKGLDITEAFEVHHISKDPRDILEKYFVRKAKVKRNAPFTFKDDGFYRTLKKEIAKVLPTLPKQSARTSNFLIDSFLVALFFLSIFAVKYWNFLFAVLAGNFLAFLTIAAHNYFHRKDNFRMYYFNFSLMQVREWRISHVLSHHLHTNTIDDYEISSWQPLLQYLPVENKPLYGYGQWLIAPLIWISGFHRALLTRSAEDYDWGFSQLDAIMDRKEITGSHFLVLTNFGDHALHHMFPTLDHGTLELLYPVFHRVMKEFDTNLRMVSQLDTIYGGFQQLVKVKPSDSVPDLKKYPFKF
ncbi:cytochrome b5-related protein-like isoform X2 [Sitophilus oryzae]|uniref:Cytochrome b5-related protein n=1 Tax=Sitophilus oryzae TaxID=7048 RepID=A0A6J2XKF3_SITOR|nr:cytochrome b5-related protein-like isoform X2 [Sitophilus oryzae]